VRVETIYKELISKNMYLDKQLEEDRKTALERERLFAYKGDFQTMEKHVSLVEAKMHEFNTEYDDTLSDMRKSNIDFNKRVTEWAKGLSTLTKDHEDLSNAAEIASQAQDLLNSCAMKLETTDNELKKIQKKLDSKINNDEFYKLIQKKMDRQEVN
jgi:chromosome segregation ATPase